MAKNKLGLLQIKELLRDDPSFRDQFPEYHKEIRAFLADPSCSCHAPLYRKIANALDTKRPSTNTAWEVINCKVTELEARLRALPHIPTQFALSRYQDEVTIVLRLLATD